MNSLTRAGLLESCTKLHLFVLPWCLWLDANCFTEYAGCFSCGTSTSGPTWHHQRKCFLRSSDTGLLDGVLFSRKSGLNTSAVEDRTSWFLPGVLCLLGYLFSRSPIPSELLALCYGAVYIHEHHMTKPAHCPLSCRLCLISLMTNFSLYILTLCILYTLALNIQQITLASLLSNFHMSPAFTTCISLHCRIALRIHAPSFLL